ncbi:MAG: hypothetical protein D6715_12865 [Calditrichaeota bacterium]|nr:MAG: hypothetical protein D6715_12865 [Calditrichota bacterium]
MESKRVWWAVLLVLWLAISGSTQIFQDPYLEPEQSRLLGGLGMTWIDDQPYTTFTLAPDFAFGKFGFGLYFQLLFDNQNGFQLRKDEYKGGVGLLRAVRYVRYGHKYDPVYLRLGSIESYTMGSGFLMWNYNNASNYDKRKVGVVADLDFGKIGIESIYSSLANLEIVGGNFYLRPFRFMNPVPPLLGRFRVHATYLHDDRLLGGTLLDSTETLDVLGFGADLQWLDLPFLKSAVYWDYGKIIHFGSGNAVGINAIFPDLIGVFGLGARFEKRYLGAQFIPSLFGPLYELNRNLGVTAMLQAQPKTEGYFGELSGHVIKRIRLIGSFQKLNGISHSGILHLEASAPRLVPRFELRAYYDKTNIETFKDARTLDFNSVATVEVGYQLNRFLMLTTIYRWYWVEQTDASGLTVYKPVERIEPRISFHYAF